LETTKLLTFWGVAFATGLAAQGLLAADTSGVGAPGSTTAPETPRAEQPDTHSQAELGGSMTSQTPALVAEVRTESGPRIATVRRAYLTAGTNRFAFVVPDGFRLDASEPEKIRLVSPDYHCLCTIRLLCGLPEAQAPAAQACRQLLLSEHPEAIVLSEFALNAADRYGPAFDLRWNAKGGMLRTERAAFIPSRAGVFEFSAVGSPTNLTETQTMLSQVMLSLSTSGPDGKLVVHPLSNRL